MNKFSPTTIRSISILAIAVIGIGIYAPVALAAAPPAKAAAPTPPPVNNAGQALEIAPPVITLSADPGKVIKTQINLRDISSSNLLVKGQVNDFVAAGEDGTPKILLDDTSNNPYSIKGWVASFPDLLMIPKQIRTLPVTITVPANASPGGHYGVVRFTATPPELKDTGVSLSASLGSLILINVSGDIKDSMNVQEFTVSHNGKAGTLFESAPVSFTERLKNTGNTHEQPTGQVVITDMFGKKVGAVNVNLPPRNVLPNSIRKFDQPLDSTVIGNKKLFGKYTADLKVAYGAKNQSTTASLTFWIIPYKLIGIIVATLIIGFFILRFFIQRYNRSIINRASRRR